MMRKVNDWCIEEKGLFEVKCNIKSGTCVLYNNEDDKEYSIHTVFSIYNWQYGVLIEDDKLIMSSWEKGLYCYDIQTGNILWHDKTRKVKSIYRLENYIIANAAKRGIVVYDLDSGEICELIKMGTIEFLFRISKYEFFVGYFRNNTYLYEMPEGKIKKIIPIKSLNVNNCASFVIRDCVRVGDKIEIEGFEEYPNGNLRAKGVAEFKRSFDFSQL